MTYVYGYTEAKTSLFYLVSGVAVIVAVVPVGYMARKLGKKAIMAGGLLLWAVAFFFSFFVQIIETLLFPLVMVFTSFSRLVLKVFKINVKPKKVSYTEEEIKTFLDVG